MKSIAPLCLLLCLPLSIGTSEIRPNVIKLTTMQKVCWEEWLPAIVTVESSNYIWAVSWRGAHHGRGLYQLSEICLIEYQRYHPGTEWMEPKCLYNTNIARMIALWLLQKHERDFRSLKPNENVIPYVLSAYNKGARATLEDGVNYEYVDAVYRSMK